MKLANVGSISHGTLRTEDLLATFREELDAFVRKNITELTPHDLYRFGRLVGAAECISPNDEDWDIITKLQDALNEFSPPYCYFGSHEDDGSDFGFWPCMDEINELPKVSDPNEVEHHLGEECVFVNDHGNVTVYDSAGKPVLELI